MNEIFLLANKRSRKELFSIFNTIPTINWGVDGGYGFFDSHLMILSGDGDSAPIYGGYPHVEKKDQNLSDLEHVLSLIPSTALKFAVGFQGGDLSHDHINQALLRETLYMVMVQNRSLSLTWVGKLELFFSGTFSLLPKGEIEITGARYSGKYDPDCPISQLSRNEGEGNKVSLYSENYYTLIIDVDSLEVVQDITHQLHQLYTSETPKS